MTAAAVDIVDSGFQLRHIAKTVRSSRLVGYVVGPHPRETALLPAEQEDRVKSEGLRLVEQLGDLRIIPVYLEVMRLQDHTQPALKPSHPVGYHRSFPVSALIEPLAVETRSGVPVALERYICERRQDGALAALKERVAYEPE